MMESLDPSNLVKPGDAVYLLGKRMQIDKFNLEEQNELLYKRFSETPWLTYRSGFPQLYHDIKGTFVSDTGWGCMIRVGQMAFAEIIKTHKMINTQTEMREVVELFNDFDREQPFSIQNISKLARKEYGILPGDWYNPSQISHILSLLNQTHLESKLQLSFLVFNSGNLFFDQIIEVMLAGR